MLALLQTGGHPPKVEAELIEQIRAIPGDFHFETFISLSCHNCPDVVQALNLMAVLNPGISHTTVSYTHLDVYKRQLLILAVKPRPTCPVESSSLAASVLVNNPTSCTAPAYADGAASEVARASVSAIEVSVFTVFLPFGVKSMQRNVAVTAL